MATYSRNTTIKIGKLYGTLSYAHPANSGSVPFTIVETNDNEHAFIHHFKSVGGAGNGVIFEMIDKTTGDVIFSQGAANSLQNETFTKYLKNDFIFLPPNHKFTYKNAVSGTGVATVQGTKYLNTP